MKTTVLTSKKFLNEAETGHLENTLRQFSTKDPRNSLILALLLHTGARPSELLACTTDDFDWDRESLYIHGLKGSNDRDVPLNQAIAQRLKDWIKFGKRGPADKIFPIAYNTLGQIWREYRPCPKTLRCLRHTFALNIYKKSRDARLVQKLLGHRHLATTEIYMDWVYTQEEFRKIICG